MLPFSFTQLWVRICFLSGPSRCHDRPIVVVKDSVGGSWWRYKGAGKRHQSSSKQRGRIHTKNTTDTLLFPVIIEMFSQGFQWPWLMQHQTNCKEQKYWLMPSHFWLVWMDHVTNAGSWTSFSTSENATTCAGWLHTRQADQWKTL